MHANRVCRFVCRFSAAKYDFWGYQLRQVAAFHREITAFCRYSVLPFSALLARAFNHSAWDLTASFGNWSNQDSRYTASRSQHIAPPRSQLPPQDQAEA